MRIDTKAAKNIRVDYGNGVFVQWPALFKDKGWSVWDSRSVRQGARHESDHRTFKKAEAAALALRDGVEP